MTRIDFYLLNDDKKKARYDFACRLIDKAYRQGHRLYLHVNDQTEAQALDDLLWSYRDDSFLPHNLYGENSSPTPPIQIGFAITPTEHADTLLNFTQDVPAFYQNFNRVVEIVLQDEMSRKTARQHYKLYREQGCELQSHDMNKSTHA
jgi:DNA polymerase-3 subunit chi